MDKLILTILYTRHDKISSKIFEAISLSKCQIINIYLFSTQTDHSTLTLVLGGSWDQLTRFETHFNRLKQKYPFQSLIEQTTFKPYYPNMFAYEIHITSSETPYVLNDILKFLDTFPITFHKFSTTLYKAPLTQTAMIETSFVLMLSKNDSISHFRESLLLFCDENNFEVTLEPYKH